MEWADYSGNTITRIENAYQNKYLKHLNLDNNLISKIEGLSENVNLRVLSLNGNNIQDIENLDHLHIEELYLSTNHITVIFGLQFLPALHTLDLSKNEIERMRGLEYVETLRFLNLSLNQVRKITQLRFIENLPLITEVDFCFNPIQNVKHYRFQVLYHIPQLRALDGTETTSEEKIKAENLHGLDLNDRELIFKNLLAEETFVDRRISKFEEIEVESESDEDIKFIEAAQKSSMGSHYSKANRNSQGVMSGKPSRMGTARSHHTNTSSIANFTKQYVGELLNKAHDYAAESHH